MKYRGDITPEAYAAMEDGYEQGYEKGEADAAGTLEALREKIAAELPAECWVTRTDVVFCTQMIGGSFGNGSEFTKEMCCLPCKIRAVLADG